MFGTTFVNAVKSIVKAYLESTKPAELAFGEVTSTAPLKIKIDNRLEVDETFLLLSAFVREKWINVPTDEEPNHTHPIPQWKTDPAGEGPHTHTIPAWQTDPDFPKIKLWRGLKVGDKVRRIRLKAGQLYYVIERVEGITNDA